MFFKFFILSLVYVYPLQAEPLTLFEMVPYQDSLFPNSDILIPSTVHNYPAIIESLKPRDKIRFTNNDIYIVGEKRGSGNTAIIFDLLDCPGEAIRLPTPTPDKLKVSPLIFIDFFIEGDVTLKRLECPSVEIFKSLESQYVRVSSLPKNAVFFPDFINNPTKKMKLALIEFAKKTAGFSMIFDFNYKQVAYLPDNDLWILFDWTAPHTSFMSKDTHVFQSIFPYSFWDPEHLQIKWVTELQENINDVIKSERKRILKLPLEQRVIYHPLLFEKPYSDKKMTCAEMLLEVQKL